MPVATHVLPRLNLAIFVYSGQVRLAEALEAVGAVSRHPHHHDTMRQLCDLSGITAIERGPTELMKMQARLAEYMLPKRGEKLVVFYAPHPVARNVAHMARKSWDGVDSVLVRVVETEEQALALLGLGGGNIAQLVHIGA